MNHDLTIIEPQMAASPLDANQQIALLEQELAVLRQEQEHLKTEALALKESSSLYQQAMAAASNGISLASATLPDEPLIYVNAAFEQVTGYSAAEVLGHNCRFLQGPATDPLAVKAIRQAINEGCVGHTTLLNYRKDGTPFWNEFSIAPIHDAQGNLTHFVGIQADVTARKQAELALQESEQRFASIIGSAMDSIISIDEKHQILLFNAAAETMFGYKAAEVLGKDLTFLLPGRYHQHHSQHITTFGQTKTTKRSMGTLDLVYGLRADDTEFPIEASISQVEVSGQKIMTVILRDVTERQRAEEERHRLQEEIIRIQSSILQELSTPLIPLSDDIVVLPLIGSVDTLRANQVMETLLHGVERQRARIAILDITGVPVVDTQVANALMHAAQAVQLLGAQVILTGIRPEIAQTLVGLGINFGKIVTRGTLQSGIAYAMGQDQMV